MGFFEGKQVVLVGCERIRAKLSKLIKNDGGYFSTGYKSANYFVVNPFIFRSSNAYEFATNYPERIIPLNELYKKLGLEEQLPCIQEIYDIFDMYTDDAEHNFEVFKRIYRCNVSVTHDDDLYFNDECLEFYGIGSYDAEDNELFERALREVVGLNDKEIKVVIKSDNIEKAYQALFNINNFIPGFTKMAGIALAARAFINKRFCTDIKIYRDKWEYRGDYVGMSSSPYEVPPRICWEISNNFPNGYMHVEKYTWADFR